MEKHKIEEIKNWYVLRVMGGKEKKTVSLIEKEIDRMGMNSFISIDWRRYAFRGSF